MFPELHEQVADEDDIFSPNALWFELLPLVEEAHRAGNDDRLKRIYGYAAWSHQQGGELANAVGVSFYEHLLDEAWMRPLVMPWLSPPIVQAIRPLWAARLAPNDLQAVEKLIRGK